jgi:arylsulfatase A-like enzyme
VDIAPSFLEIAGLESPKSFEGVSFLPILKKNTAKTRRFVFAEDHWHDFEDHGRAVVNQRWKLIRNTYPDLPNTPSADAGRSPTWTAIQRLREENRLTPAQFRCLKKPRAQLEFYDLKNDPFELTNLAENPNHFIENPNHETVLEDMMAMLELQFKRTNDYLPSKRTPDEFDRETGDPDHSVRRRPRASKKEMFGTNGAY